MSTVTGIKRFVPLAALTLLAACGQGVTDDEPSPTGDVDPGGSVTDDDTVYRGALTVLDDGEQGPQLCGAVMESYPPQCGGPDVAGWDWDAVAHEDAQGVRWGDYLVTGTFDGETFTLTEDPVPTDEIDLSDYPELEPVEPDVEEPAEPMSEAELDQVFNEVHERFPKLLVGGWVDEQHGVVMLSVLAVTPDLASFVESEYPEGTVVASPMLRPVE
jgi:hypothetical protein